MVMKLEDTPRRISRRKYEALHKEERKQRNQGFSAMLFREEADEIKSFLAARGIGNAQFIREAFKLYKNKILEEQNE